MLTVNCKRVWNRYDNRKKNKTNGNDHFGNGLCSCYPRMSGRFLFFCTSRLLLKKVKVETSSEMVIFFSSLAISHCALHMSHFSRDPAVKTLVSPSSSPYTFALLVEWFYNSHCARPFSNCSFFFGRKQQH